MTHSAWALYFRSNPRGLQVFIIMQQESSRQESPHADASVQGVLCILHQHSVTGEELFRQDT